MHQSLKKANKRPFLLLEVLIAFALVLMCAFPLLTTQAFMTKLEKESLRTIEIDRLVNILLVGIVEDLFKQQADWKELQNGIEVEINSTTLRKLSFPALFPYQVKYNLLLKVDEDKEENKEDKEDTKHLLKTVITFTPENKTEKPLTFSYELFVKRHLLAGQALPTDNPPSPNTEKGANPTNEGESP